MLSLSGYHLTEKLYQSGRTSVYRGTRLNDQASVIVKALHDPNPSVDELLQFHNQYAITRYLNHPLIVCPLSLEQQNNGYVLVMPDEGFVPLSTYSQQGGCQLSQVLAIALQLADALHYLMRQRVIQKDIKPSNILIAPETSEIRLIDFSIASLLPKERQQLANPNVLEGTLAYISPEQTGRMNRGIDYRTDFYSLGATLFELLVGELPFPTTDPLELIHCHIAQPVQFPARKQQELPGMVQQMIMKLMAKNAEDRYQSALGLQHDLNRCLEAWETSNQITPFPLGERDACDRFLIPEKLYGREREVQTLLDAFTRVTRGKTELMLVAGFSGIGKTAVINEVHKPITRQRGYFIQGKFDQFNRNVPFSAFVQVFRNLMGQLLGESDRAIAAWKVRILEAVGDNGQVMIEVIPELETIIGKQPPVPELSGTAAQNRFNTLFSQFVRVFATRDHPLVIFLDDLQWADLPSLKLLKLLVSDPRSGSLLLLGAYRDNEVFPAHPFMLTLDELRQTGATLNTLCLAPLKEADINQLVADTLLCSSAIAAPLSELVYQKTQGNPFFATQFLKGLQEEGWITFAADAGYWQCDLTKVRECALTDDVVGFMAQQLQKLPRETQSVLKLAACIGNQFDLSTLAIASEHSELEISTLLWPALQQGLILPQNQIYKFYLGSDPYPTEKRGLAVHYQFLHDRVQQAAYSLISERERQATHYQIGQLLLQNISLAAQEEGIFELVNQLNYGTDLISDQQERDKLAQLNWRAGNKARNALAYEAAQEYARVGISLLGASGWEQRYDLALALHELAAEVAVLSNQFQEMETWVATIQEHSQQLLDTVTARRMQILGKTLQSQPTEAVRIGIALLRELGVTLPEAPTAMDMQAAVAEINQLLGDRAIPALADLPPLRDRVQLAIVKVASNILGTAYLSGSPFYPLLVCLCVKVSIQYGNTLASPTSYAFYGALLCTLFQDIDTGVEFGQLAIEMTAVPEAKTAKPEVIAPAVAFILHRKIPVRDLIGLTKEGYVAGLEVGNLEHAGYNLVLLCNNGFACGQPLQSLEQEIRTYLEGLEERNQNAADYCWVVWQLILNLLGKAEQPTVLSGEILREETFLPAQLSSNEPAIPYQFYIHKSILCFLLDDLEQAQTNIVETRRYFLGGAGLINEPTLYFYESLITLAPLQPHSQGTETALEKVAENQTQLQGQWAYHAPMNHQHKADLVSAEQYRVLGEPYRAGDYYDRAIAGAKENEFLHEEALANELAAKFYWQWGKPKVAAGYLQEAYYGYARWGAKVKTDQLAVYYTELLAPILQPSSGVTFGSLLSRGVNTQTTQASESNPNSTFDLLAILKASQIISSTITLEDLLHQLTHIVLQNSGGDRCAIILCQRSETMQVGVTGTINAITLSATPLDNAKNLPRQLLQYVKRTGQLIVSNGNDLPVVDDYLREQQPASFLCLPLVDQSQLRGLLYVENRTTSGVFNTGRIATLNLLATQAAIALENARLYQQAQAYTEQLQTLNMELVESQSRLHQFLEALPVGTVVHRQDGQMTYINQAGKRLLRIDHLPVTKQEEFSDIFSIYCAETQERYPTPKLPVSRALQGELVYEENLELHQNQQIIPLEVWASPIFNEQGEIAYAIVAFQDISARKRTEKQLIYNAQHDALTDLPNRSLLEQRLELSINRRKQEENYRFALLFLDLDNFKVINDSLGHLAGDELLIRMGCRLQAMTRASDLVARLGGDEFVILLEQIDSISAIINFVERIFTTFREPMQVAEQSVTITTSIGVVVDAENYNAPSEILRDADLALYQAKGLGKGQYAIFNLEMHTQILKRMRLENDLRRAMEQNEMRVHYQPIISLNTGNLAGFEALLRWQHPEQGLIAPGEFIPIAEETGLIVPLDQWVLKTACEQLAHWHQLFPYYSHLTVSVNLSSRDLKENNLIAEIEDILSQTGLDAKTLVLELTESILIENISQTITQLSELRHRNLKVSIDDFGTGYSSLSYLCMLPADSLKIDKSFVSQMHRGNKNYQVIETIITLSNQLHLNAIAEGIETQQQLAWLQAMGCELGQGFLFSPPLTPSAVTERLAQSPNLS